MTESHPSAVMDRLGETVHQRLRALGLSLRPDWVQDAVQQATRAQPQLGRAGAEDPLLQLVFRQALGLDLQQIGAPCLPVELAQQHKTHLEGRLVLQLESVSNTGHNLEDRVVHFNDARRTALLELTDGSLLVRALELERCDSLNELAQRLEPRQTGGKLVLQGRPEIRRGVILLRPHNVKVLGGFQVPPPQADGRLDHPDLKAEPPERRQQQKGEAEADEDEQMWDDEALLDDALLAAAVPEEPRRAAPADDDRDLGVSRDSGAAALEDDFAAFDEDEQQLALEFEFDH